MNTLNLNRYQIITLTTILASRIDSLAEHINNPTAYTHLPDDFAEATRQADAHYLTELQAIARALEDQI